MYIALIVFEVILAAFGVWCILNEKKLLAFEERIEKRYRRWRKKRQRKTVARYLRENNIKAVALLGADERITITGRGCNK